MEKIYDLRVICDPILKKLIMEIKIAFLIIMVSVSNLLATDTYSQVAKVSLDMENRSLEQVMDEIEKQSEFYFIFNQKQIDVHRIVDIQADNRLITDILPELFKGTSVHYAVFDRKILLTTDPLEENHKTVRIITELQQKQVVTGTVIDSDGVPLPGVNILVVGTPVGVITDINGKYSIEIPQGARSLRFTFIGMVPQEIIIGAQTQIDVTLALSAVGLEEVVVVGYGTQRVGTITGSVSTVKEDQVTKVSVPTVSQALQGKTSGVFIKNVSGQPSDSKVQINIRGFGTPLIIIDGMPATLTDFQELNPNDIEDMSILKDAAASAVYGARAGNGVIIIKTKRGILSKPQVTFTSDYSAQYLLPFSLPKPIDSHQWMELRNWSEITHGRTPTFSRELIELYRQHADGSEPILYPNVNMYEEALKDYAPMYTGNLSLRGGSQNVSYFLSGNYLHQRDILVADETAYNRLSLRSNTDANVTEKLKISVDVSFQNRDFIGPRSSMEGEGSWQQGQSVTGRLRRWRPFHTIEPIPGHPDKPRGAVGGATINPLNIQRIDLSGYNSYNVTAFDTKITMDYILPFGFSTKYTFNYYNNHRRNKINQKLGEEYNYNEETGEAFWVRNNNSRKFVRQGDIISKNINMQWFLNYDHTFAGKHGLTGLLVAEYLSDTYDMYEAWRLDYDFDMDHLFAGPEGKQFNTSAMREGGRMGFIGKLAYNYAGKYSIEASARYDGSPQFPEETRWGFFPSVSVAWLISKESFIANSASLAFISNLKLRASYGRLGYDGAGDWQYLATYRFASPYIYSGSDAVRGIRTDAIPNPYITWEKMDLANIGMDFYLFKGVISGTFDIFQRNRTDVLGTRLREIPNIVGATMPNENYREFQNRGWDLMLNHENSKGHFVYNIGANLSWNREVVKVIDEPDFATMDLWRRNSQIGRASDRVLLYPSEGLFRSQEQIDSWADIDGRNNATIKPGDIKWVDTNGDGRITQEDMIAWNRGDMPRFTGGINATASYKGFEVFMAWQGAALFGFDLRRTEYVRPWCCDGMPFQHMFYDSYIPEGSEWMPANLDAKYPRPLINNSHRNWMHNQEFWWIDGKYLRLKQLQLSYTLPQQLTSRFGVERFRVYVSGTNLITFSTNDFTDPEIDTNPKQTVGFYHPQMGSYNFGLELSF